MIPALRNCNESPEPGCTTKTTVSTTYSTSVSLWPTPTVSTSTQSANAAPRTNVGGRRCACQPAELLSGYRKGTHEEALITRIAVDPGAVAEQSAPGAFAGRVHCQDSHRLATRTEHPGQRVHQGALARAGRSR